MYTTIWITLLISTAFAASSAEGKEPKKKQVSLDGLKWLAGSWSGKLGDDETEEHWIEPKSGVMLGMNRTVAKNGKVSFEFLRIAVVEKEIIYYAGISGRKPTPFTLVKLIDNEVTFENPKNEFPQRIIYSRKGKQLKARIEGKIEGKAQSMQWTWSRKSQKD